MPDLISTANDLKGMPDQALQMELAHPSGAVPTYLVMAEAQRRATLRSGAAQHQQAQGSVYDDVLRSLMARQPPAGPPPPPGMTPVAGTPPSGQAPAPSGLGQLTAPPAPGALPTPPGMAEGGSVDDLEDDDEGGDEPAVQAVGSADRSAGSTSDIERYIQEAAKENNLPPELIRSVMAQENAKRDPNAVSRKGAVGLMQLEPGTARDMGVTDPTDPEQNVHGGSRYLAEMLKRYHGNRSLALAAYNAGPGTVDKYGGVPPYPETQKYVAAVEKNLNSAPPPPPPPDVDTDTSSPPTATTPTTDAGPPAVSTDELNNLPMNIRRMPNQQETIQALQAPATDTAPPAAVAKIPGVDKNEITQYVRGLFPTLDQQNIRAEVARLHAQAAQLGKKNFWQMLADFGWGMAASPSHYVAQQIAAGGMNMTHSQQTREEQARQMELNLLGVDSSLDNQARTYQEKLAETTQKAVDQATRNQDTSFKNLFHVTGATYGPANQSLGQGYTFTADPNNPNYGVWIPPSLMPVTKSMVNFLGENPATGKPYNSGDMIPYAQWMKVKNAGIDIAKKGEETRPTVAAGRIAEGVNQVFRDNPDLPRPKNPDGTDKPQERYQYSDLPPEYQMEATINTSIINGITQAKAQDMVVRGTPQQKQLGQAILDRYAAQAGKVAGARAKGTYEGMANELTPGALDTMSEAYINGKFTSRNPAVMAIVANSAAEKLKARGMTSQSVIAQQNAAKSNMAALTDITKTNAAATAFSDTAVNAMTNLDQAARSVSDLGAPVLNTPIRDLQSKFGGNPKVSAFYAALGPVKADLARIISSPNLKGVLTDEARSEMAPALGEGATYAQLLAAMQVFYKDMQGRKDAYAKEMDLLQHMTTVGSAMPNTPTPGAGVTSPPQQTAQPTTAPGPAAGGAPKRATLNGRTIVAKKDGWYYEDTGQKAQ